MIKPFIALGTALVASLHFCTANADTISFDAVDGVRFLRCTETVGVTFCEVLRDTMGPMRCIALDATGEPIAVDRLQSEADAVAFNDLDPDSVDDMICEPV